MKTNGSAHWHADRRSLTQKTGRAGELDLGRTNEHLLLMQAARSCAGMGATAVKIDSETRGEKPIETKPKMHYGSRNQKWILSRQMNGTRQDTKTYCFH
jgi:hypothetical protein